MTLVVALRCADGIALAADSRVAARTENSAPRQFVDGAHKLTRLGPDTGIMSFGLTIPGVLGMRALQDDARDENEGFVPDEMHLERAAHVLGQTYAAYLEEKREADGTIPQILTKQGVGYILASVDRRRTGAFRMYVCSSTDGFRFEEEDERAYLMGGQWHLAVGLLSSLFRPTEPTAEGVIVATALLLATAASDSTVGGPFRVATIRDREGFRTLPRPQLRAAVKSASDALAALPPHR